MSLTPTYFQFWFQQGLRFHKVTIHVLHHITFAFSLTLSIVDPPLQFVYPNPSISFVNLSGIRSPIQHHFLVILFSFGFLHSSFRSPRSFSYNLFFFLDSKVSRTGGRNLHDPYLSNLSRFGESLIVFILFFSRFSPSFSTLSFSSFYWFPPTGSRPLLFPSLQLFNLLSSSHLSLSLSCPRRHL